MYSILGIKVALSLILSASIIGIHDVLNEEASGKKKEHQKNLYNNTYKYISSLPLDEIHEYINYNYDLNYYQYRIFRTCNKNDKYNVSKHIAELSVYLDKPFTNKNKRY